MKYKKAVVVIDMINDFVKEKYEWPPHEEYPADCEGKYVAPLGKTIIYPIEKMIVAGLKNDAYVIFLEDEHTEYSEEIRSGEHPEHAMKGTPGAETVYELSFFQNNGYSKNIKKDTYSAFTNPELDEFLLENDIREVYLTGLVQEICIKENAEAFVDRGHSVKVVADATVPFNSYKGYKALKEIEEYGAEIIDLETALEEVCA